MRGETSYPFPNVDGCTAEVWEWISKFIPHFTGTELFIHAEIKANPC